MLIPLLVPGCFEGAHDSTTSPFRRRCLSRLLSALPCRTHCRKATASGVWRIGRGLDYLPCLFPDGAACGLSLCPLARAAFALDYSFRAAPACNRIRNRMVNADH